MSKIMFRSVLAASILASGAVAAADLPNRNKAPAMPVVAPAFSWTGLYLGVNAGYGFGSISKAGVYFNDKQSFVGGGQVGYNYQFAPNLVLGIEADLQTANLRASANAVGVNASLSRSKNGVEW